MKLTFILKMVNKDFLFFSFGILGGLQSYGILEGRLSRFFSYYVHQFRMYVEGILAAKKRNWEGFPGRTQFAP